MITRYTSILPALAAALLSIGTATHSVHAADIKERTIKLPVVTTIDHPLGIGAAKFSELVRDKSGGKMKVKVFPGGTLGGEAQVISSLQGGTIEATIVLPAALGGLVKDFIILDLPYVFESEQQAAQVLDGPVGEQLLNYLPPKGLVGLGFMESGFRNFSNSKHPITKLEDLAGLKLRSLQNPLFVDFTNALGANAVTLPFTELYTALETKAVDGQENTYATVENAKFDEVQKCLSATRHVYAAQIILISNKFWNQLSADERGILQAAAAEAIDYQRKAAREANSQARETLKKRGMQVNDLSPEEIAKIRDTVKPVVDKYAGQVSEDLRNKFFSEVEKARQ